MPGFSKENFQLNPRIKLENFKPINCRLSSLIRGLSREIFMWPYAQVNKGEVLA